MFGRNEELLELILNHLEDYAIFVTDEKGVITHAYAGVAPVLGYSTDELIGQSGRLLFTEEDQKSGVPEREMETGRTLGKSLDERWHQKKDGSKFWASGFLVRLRDRDDPRVRGFLKIMRDLTARKQSEDHLQGLNEQLENQVQLRTVGLREAVERLQAFNYTVAHDLRSPIRHMGSYAQLVREEEAETLSDQSKQLLRRIEASADRLEQLIQDLLRYSRVSQSELRLETVDLSTVIGTCLRQRQSEIRGKEALVSVREPLPQVHGNATALEHVVDNLLSNALKYVAPAVRPKIEIWAEAHPPKMRLWFANNGIGIEPRHHERIFRMFERLHGIEAYSGTGVGLAIVAEAVRKMRGEVGVESDAGQGSKFWLELLLASQPNPSHVAEPPPATNR
jgi:PAS domain S-box-containing protein